MNDRSLGALLSSHSAQAQRGGTFNTDRARHAVDLALHCLRGLEITQEVRELIDRAEALRTDLDQRSTMAASAEAREGIMRAAMSIQVAAVGILSRARRARDDAY